MESSSLTRDSVRIQGMEKSCKASVVLQRFLRQRLRRLKTFFPHITVLGELQNRRRMVTAVELGGEIVLHKGKQRKARKGLSQEGEERAIPGCEERAIPGRRNHEL